jgi:hypothetical protein
MDTGANGIIGRDLHTLRPMGCEQGALNRTDGSARFSHQDTVVLASVQGPSQVQKRLEMASRATVEVIFKPVAGAPGAPEKEMESVLRQIVRRPPPPAWAARMTTPYGGEPAPAGGFVPSVRGPYRQSACWVRWRPLCSPTCTRALLYESSPRRVYSY